MSRTTIVGFDRKGDLIDCAWLCQRELPVLVLRWQELQIAMLQAVGDVQRFINTLTQLLASHLSLFASRRLMLETLVLLFNRARRPATWPVLDEWIDLIDRVRANALSRLGQYREALLYGLLEIKLSFGDVLSYAASDMIEKITRFQGLAIILTDGLSPPMASLLASLFVHDPYERRGLDQELAAHQLTYIFDDAGPLTYGSHPSEVEGGLNPLSTWAFHGRSRGIGFVVSAQNYSLISPVWRMNAANIVCCGAYGRDAQELKRDLHLTDAQAELLHVMQPGECVALCRGVWPLAVKGQFPELP